MLDKFKGKLASTTVIPSPKTSIRIGKSLTMYEFSQRKIFFNIEEDLKLNKDISDKIIISYGQPYKLIRITKDDFYEWSKNAKFQAEIRGERFAILTDRWNGILLRIVHKRYWVQQNKDWALKVFLGALIVTIVGMILKKIFG